VSIHDYATNFASALYRGNLNEQWEWAYKLTKKMDPDLDIVDEKDIQCILRAVAIRYAALKRKDPPDKQESI